MKAGTAGLLVIRQRNSIPIHSAKYNNYAEFRGISGQVSCDDPKPYIQLKIKFKKDS